MYTVCRSLGVIKMEPIQKIELIERIADRLMDSGRIKNEQYAREIAIRWANARAG